MIFDTRLLREELQSFYQSIVLVVNSGKVNTPLIKIVTMW